jgi:hypothetical protein
MLYFLFFYFFFFFFFIFSSPRAYSSFRVRLFSWDYEAQNFSVTYDNQPMSGTTKLGRMESVKYGLGYGHATPLKSP